MGMSAVRSAKEAKNFSDNNFVAGGKQYWFYEAAASRDRELWSRKFAKWDKAKVIDYISLRRFRVLIFFFSAPVWLCYQFDESIRRHNLLQINFSREVSIKLRISSDVGRKKSFNYLNVKIIGKFNQRSSWLYVDRRQIVLRTMESGICWYCYRYSNPSGSPDVIRINFVTSAERKITNSNPKYCLAQQIVIQIM